MLFVITCQEINNPTLVPGLSMVGEENERFGRGVRSATIEECPEGALGAALCALRSRPADAGPLRIGR